MDAHTLTDLSPIRGLDVTWVSIPEWSQVILMHTPQEITFMMGRAVKRENTKRHD
jgi:hypothetical protein